ncbi:hypothetical protein R50073_33640 [Maricurvus nonylphenolicus]|uniref:hypothetical protein n=1 Tax=Maricurvus nonylphenolicus TaxID=1008307 RepID=UPI0036F43F58
MAKLCGFLPRWLLLLSIWAIHPSMADTATPDASDEEPTVLRFMTIEHPRAEAAREMIESAYNRIGHYRIQLIPAPPKRSLYQAGLAQFADGELVRAKLNEEDYPSLIRVEHPISCVAVVAVSQKKDTYPSMMFLKHQTVGVIHGRFGFFELLEDSELIYTTNAKALLKMVAAGRLEVGVMDKHEAMLNMKALALDNIKVNEPDLMEGNVYHYLHIKNRHLVEPLTQVFIDMRGEGLLGRSCVLDL